MAETYREQKEHLADSAIGPTLDGVIHPGGDYDHAIRVSMAYLNASDDEENH